MTLQESIQMQEILLRYKSVRAFTTAVNIPYSTLDSVFRRGIANAGISTMLKEFDALDLDIESVTDGELRPRPPEYKKSPSTAEAAPGEERISLEDSNKLLVALGLIQEGQELSDDDLAFLEHVIGLLDTWSGKRR